jgi:hypothetical protein
MKLLNFFYFCGSFFPFWIRIRIPNPDPDPLTRLNPDSIRIQIRIRIRNPAKKKAFSRGTWLDANAVGEQGLTGRYGDCGGRGGS